MANKKIYTESYIQDIADAIREKNKKVDQYKTSEMAEAIRSLSGGFTVRDMTIYRYDVEV